MSMQNLYRERTGLDPEEEVNLEEAIRSLDVYGTMRGLGDQGRRPTLGDSSYNLTGGCSLTVHSIVLYGQGSWTVDETETGSR